MIQIYVMIAIITLALATPAAGNYTPGEINPISGHFYYVENWEEYDKSIENGVIKYPYVADTIYRQEDGSILIYMDNTIIPKGNDKLWGRYTRMEDETTIYSNMIHTTSAKICIVYSDIKTAVQYTVLSIVDEDNTAVCHVNIPEWDANSLSGNRYPMKYEKYEDINKVVDLIECVPVVKDMFTSEVLNDNYYCYQYDIEKVLARQLGIPQIQNFDIGESIVIPVLKGSGKGIVTIGCDYSSYMEVYYPNRAGWPVKRTSIAIAKNNFWLPNFSLAKPNG